MELLYQPSVFCGIYLQWKIFVISPRDVRLSFEVKIKWQLFTEQDKENSSSHALWFEEANESFHNSVEATTTTANLNSMLNGRSCHLPDQQYATLLKFALFQLLQVKLSFPKGTSQKVNRILVIKAQ